jgi:predicted transcriptional regulator of viral defense system
MHPSEGVQTQRTGAMTPPARAASAAVIHRCHEAVGGTGDEADAVAMENLDLTYVHRLDEVYEHRVSHSRAATAGSEIRVIRGVYAAATEWSAANPRARYRTRIRATVDTRRTQMVVSHWSAAALHGLPVLDAWPKEIHFTVGKLASGRSRNDVVKHAHELDDDDVVEVEGIAVTSIARTVIDMAAIADFCTGVMVADRALLVDRYGKVMPLATRDRLWAAFERRGSFRGAKRAANVIDFGEIRAESPLESVSRANMSLIGCPAPVLQPAFSDHLGYVGETDFGWPEFSTVGEADGRQKYLDASLLSGRTTAEALLDEKFREDRIRALGQRFTRWPWRIGVNPAALRLHLRNAGLPIP